MRNPARTGSSNVHALPRKHSSVKRLAVYLLLLVGGLAGCRGVAPPAVSAGEAALKLSSSSFQGGGIPAKFTCNGAGISPQLAWTAPPPATVSLALLVTDPDAPGGTFVHWILLNLPAGTRQIAEGATQFPAGAIQGRNDFGKSGYAGPCPPGRSPHHYVFSLYALDTKLNLSAAAPLAEIKSAMQGHILAHGELVVLYPK